MVVEIPSHNLPKAAVCLRLFSTIDFAECAIDQAMVSSIV
jgi:hypothetical protein